MLEDGEEVALGRGPLCHVAQHAVHLVGLRKLHPDVLEAMQHLLVVVLTVVLEDVQVGGQIVKLDLSKILKVRKGEVRGMDYSVHLTDRRSNLNSVQISSNLTTFHYLLTLRVRTSPT